VVLERVGGRTRRLRAPELVDQPVGRDDLVGGGEEQDEERPQPRSLERERTIAVDDLERSQDPELHASPPCGDATTAAGSAPPQPDFRSTDGGHTSATAS
jgi:hypothetical protein